MASTRVLLLLPLLLATAHAQEGGTKSSFDQILEKFGFSGLPSPSKGGSRSPTGATAPARPPQGLPQGAQATSLSQNVGQQSFRQQSSRIQNPRSQTQRSQITAPQIGRPGNKNDALAALFNVARTEKVEAGPSSAAPAKQVLNDRAASPPLIGAQRARVSNNRIISNERAALRGRKQGERRGPGRQGSGSAPATNVNSAGLRGRNQPVSPGAGTQTSLRSAPQRVNEPTESRNDAPLTSHGKQFDERLAQFGFQPRLLSNLQAAKNQAQKSEVPAKGAPPSLGSLRQQSPAPGRSETSRARGRSPGSPRHQTGGQATKASALGSLQAIAAGNSLTVQNRGKGDQVNSPSSRPVPQIQTPFSQSRPSPAQSASDTRPQQPLPNPPKQRPNPTQQRPNFGQQLPNPPQARPTPSLRPGAPRSALDNLQSIAAGEGGRLQVRNKGRGRRPPSPTQPPPRAALSPIVPAFQQPQPPTPPSVVNPFVNLNLVTFPSVSKKPVPISDKSIQSSKKQGLSSPVPSSQLRGNNLKISGEVPRSSNIRSSQNEIGRPTTFIPSETTTRPVDKRTKLPSRGKDDEEQDHTNERRDNGAKLKKKKEGKLKRPVKAKKAKQESQALPPVAPGCLQICGSLIYEVYVLLGGHVCDCPRGD